MFGHQQSIQSKLGRVQLLVSGAWLSGVLISFVINWNESRTAQLRSPKVQVLQRFEHLQPLV